MVRAQTLITKYKDRLLPKDEHFKDLVSQLMSTSIHPPEHAKARQEKHLQKYMDFLPKMDKSHITALVMNLAAADD
jgi:hypothetical protein